MRNRPRPEATKVEGSLAWKVFTQRTTLGLTQQKLAAKSKHLRPPGIGQSAIASIENGDTKWLRGPSLLALADGLEASPFWLQGDEREPTQRLRIGLDEGPAIDLLRFLTPTNLEGLDRLRTVSGRAAAGSEADQAPPIRWAATRSADPREAQIERRRLRPLVPR